MQIRELSRAECLQVLERAKIGRLACARDNQPYIVPFTFVCQDGQVLGFTTPGKKVEWMRANPRVCVQVDEIEASDRWTSVVAFGRYEELPEASNWKQELLRAHQLLQKHVGWWAPAWADRTDRNAPADFIFYRVNIDEVSGRQAVPAT